MQDKKYWNEFYCNTPPCEEPSPFVKDVLKHLKAGGTILDLGCGNGRDSFFLYQNGFKVTGIDSAEKIIEKLRQRVDHENIRFIADDFVTSSFLTEENYDYAYSRFSLHAITKKQEEILFKNILKSLVPGGRFFIEARSIHDGIFGLGKKVDKNTFSYQGHKRRFIHLEECVEELSKIGFQVEHKEEGINFAVYGDENPVVVRVAARKPW